MKKFILVQDDTIMEMYDIFTENEISEVLNALERTEDDKYGDVEIYELKKAGAVKISRNIVWE